MIASIALFVILVPIGILTTIILIFIKDPREYFEDTKTYPFGIALGIDLLGNIVLGDLFNILIIRKGGYKFGKIGDTISYVIGKNILINKLTLVGKLLNSFLNLFEKEHCLKAVYKRDKLKNN